MAAPGEKSFSVLETANYAKDPPTDKTIRAWYKQSSGRTLTAEDGVERVRASFLRSPKKSTGNAAKELSMSKTTVWRILRKRLVFSGYKCL
jgi:arsenate reductase-like glutaredoxin family protein